jgi:SMC interacting uncharacterized protein involved in chromosome segregation
MNGLVERLRQFVRECPVELFDYNPEKRLRDLAKEATNEIERLTREVARRDDQIKQLRAEIDRLLSLARDISHDLKDGNIGLAAITAGAVARGL